MVTYNVFFSFHKLIYDALFCLSRIWNFEFVKYKQEVFQMLDAGYAWCLKDAPIGRKDLIEKFTE
jgi:hypothetical protein